MLDSAKELLQQVLEKLRPALRASLPIVVLEPSCLSVFRDEAVGLFPNDEDARRLKHLACSLGELLARKENFSPLRLERKAIVQVHCHHRSVIGFTHEQQLLDKMGIQAEFPEPSCCGMAGSFGFEEGEHYDVAQACGEKHILPAVRRASDETLLLADGFSCHEQIRQGTGRTPLHFAQVLEQALCRDGRLPAAVENRPLRLKRASRDALVTGGVVLGLAGLACYFSTRRES
jgi:Fe-S oxidoreductase